MCLFVVFGISPVRYEVFDAMDVIENGDKDKSTREEVMEALDRHGRRQGKSNQPRGRPTIAKKVRIDGR